MLKMSNSDILKTIKKRELRLNNYLMNLLNKCNSEVMTDVRNWLLNSQIKLEVAKSAQMNELKKKLELGGYLLTEDDVKILRDNFIFVGGPIPKIDSDELGDDTFIVISDFCYCDTPIENILEFCKERYDDVYIIGSSTGLSRKKIVGKSYFDNLRKIKEMENNIWCNFEYIAGELDYILYGIYIGNLECCQMIKVSDELAFLIEENKDLMDWLGEKQIQAEHCVSGLTFAMAYGFYNQNFWDNDLFYCLKDVYKPDIENGVGVRELKEVVSLKPDAACYDKSALPTDGQTTVILGNASRGEFLPFASFVNGKGYTVPVVRIDGSIVYDGYALNTFMDLHYYDDREAMFHNAIMDLVYSIGQDAFTDKDYFLNPIKGLTREESLEIINNIDNQYGFTYGTMSDNEKYMMYKKIFVFDTLMNCLIKEHGTCEAAADAMDKAMLTDNINVVSDNIDARCLADALGFENIKQVLTAYSCGDVNDYVNLKSEYESRIDNKVFKKEPTEK